MISLVDRIEIKTNPAAVIAWFDALPEHYLAWHPDHVSCHFLRGSMWQVGSVLEAQEYLHGKHHTLRFIVTDVVPEKRLIYKIRPALGWGAFVLEQQGGIVLFTAELHIGSDLPLLGPVVDLVLNLFFQSRIEATRAHMREEGVNLKAILESEPVPAPVP
jgi:hypothetical protein